MFQVLFLQKSLEKDYKSQVKVTPNQGMDSATHQLDLLRLSPLMNSHTRLCHHSPHLSPSLT